MKYRRWIIAFSVIGAIFAYYFVGRWHYVNSVKAAYPKLPADVGFYYIPWPAGPQVVGQLRPDDAIYLDRDFVERHSQGWELRIFDSDGMFQAVPENSSL